MFYFVLIQNVNLMNENNRTKPKPPTVLYEKIKNIENELRDYVLEKLIENGENKVLITIPRKGGAIIEHLEQHHDELKSKLRKTFVKIVTAEEFFEMEDLHKKELIIFDDAVDKGGKIDKFLNDYRECIGESYAEQKKHIKIGAFVVNKKNCSRLLDEGKLNKELIGRIEPEEKFEFLKKILDIITYLIHTGDIIDPDHLLIKGKFKQDVPYSKIWTILKNTNDKIYEPDFGLYHPEKKKITLYDVPYFKWISISHLNKLKTFLFNWGNVPGDDSNRLLNFLKDDFEISWVENAKIVKSDDTTIRIFTEDKSVEILLEKNKEKATLKIIDGRTYNLHVKEENELLNIYIPFQCKVRFVFDMVQYNQDLFVKDFIVVPVINPPMENKWSKDCNNFENQFCNKYHKKQCVDCILCELIIKIMRGFMNSYYENLEKNNIESSIEKITWIHLYNNYGEDFSPDKLKNLIFP